MVDRDRIKRLRALTGQQEVYDNPNTVETLAEVEYTLPAGYRIRAHNIYEGSSEDEDQAPTTVSAPASNQFVELSHQQWGEESDESMTARMQAALNKSQYGTSAPLLCM